MRLDRHITPDGRGKYALLNLRTDTVEWGAVGSTEEFFVIKLKDQYASAALYAYAQAAEADDPAFAADVRGLAQRAHTHPQRRRPD